MGDVIPIKNEAALKKEAARRVKVALDCVYALLPEATPRRKKFLATWILDMVRNEHHGLYRGITEEQLRYLTEPEMQCYFKRVGRCPLMVWWSRAAQAVRMYYGEKE